jgi:hypothetical protein
MATTATDPVVVDTNILVLPFETRSRQNDQIEVQRQGLIERRMDTATP